MASSLLKIPPIEFSGFRVTNGAWMKLRSKIVRNSVLLTVVMIAVMLVVCRYAVLHGFSLLGRRHLQDHLQQTKSAILIETKSLDSLAHEYAAHAETYRLLTAVGQHRSFRADTLQRLTVSAVALVDERGRVLFSAQASDEAVSQTDLRAMTGVAGNKERSPAEPLVSLVSLSNGPALLVARPIPTKEGRNTVTLLMTRNLSGETLSDLYPRNKDSLRLREINADLSPQLTAIVRTLRSSDEEFVIRTVGPNQLVLYSLLDDVDGEPRFLMELDDDRDIFKEGLWVSEVFTFSCFGFGILYCLLAILGANLDVVKPVQQIVSFMQRFSGENTFTERLQLHGVTEIAVLGTQINRMLDEIHASRERLLAARERLQYEATHDALTGSWNRAAAMELLDRELARSPREKNTVAVVLFDADHFKRVNDKYGHSAGDIVLQNITAVISRNLRSFDVLARYGGEEFLVIAPNCTNSEARMMADRILHRLEEMPIHVGEHTISVTLSAGISSGAQPYSAEELIDAADIALYRAKSKGRNCTECEDILSEAEPRKKMFVMPRRIM